MVQSKMYQDNEAQEKGTKHQEVKGKAGQSLDWGLISGKFVRVKGDSQDITRECCLLLLQLSLLPRPDGDELGQSASPEVDRVVTGRGRVVTAPLRADKAETLFFGQTLPAGVPVLSRCELHELVVALGRLRLVQFRLVSLHQSPPRVAPAPPPRRHYRLQSAGEGGGGDGDGLGGEFRQVDGDVSGGVHRPG